MKTKEDTMTIYDILELDDQKALQVDPEYQRGPEWSIKQERLLIDSLLRGYPIPMFYLHKNISEGRWAKNTCYYIIDGQQRKNAIVKYAKNQFSMFNPSKDSKTGLAHFQRDQKVPWAGKTFDSLPETYRNNFLNTPLSIQMIETNDDNEIRDLFIRLQAGLPLSAQEKRDAWPGDFTKFIIEMAGKITSNQRWMGHDFFRKVLKGSATRGNMRKLCATMFMQFYSRRFNSYSPGSFTSVNAIDIDNFYQFNVDFNSNDDRSYGPQFRDVLDEATRLLGDGKRPKIEVNMAYNVILLLDILIDNFTPDWRVKFQRSFDLFQENLAKARRSKDPHNEFWIRYGVLTGVSAASKGRIEERYRFFEQEMLKSMSPLCRLDSKRAYSSAERELIYYRDKGVCQKCQYAVDWAEAEIDHITPHALGGDTSLENARLVHQRCHTRGTNALTSLQYNTVDGSVNKPWEEDPESSSKHLVLAPSGKRIQIAAMARAGLIIDGCKLIYPTKDIVVEAEFRSPDMFIYRENGNIFPYSSFNMLVSEKIGPRNIWMKTQVEFPDGQVFALDDLRNKYIESSYNTNSNSSDENNYDEDEGDNDEEDFESFENINDDIPKIFKNKNANIISEDEIKKYKLVAVIYSYETVRDYFVSFNSLSEINELISTKECWCKKIF